MNNEPIGQEQMTPPQAQDNPDVQDTSVARDIRVQEPFPETKPQEPSAAQKDTAAQKEPAAKVPPEVAGSAAERLVSAGERILNSRSAGLILVVLGILLLGGRLLGFPFGQYLWPLFILVPGLILLSIAFNMDGQMGEPFSILGSVISMLGLMFLAMSITGLWASWAYAWALLFPTSIGIGQILFGLHTHQSPLVKTGKSLVVIGLSIFGVGFVFFEALLHISNLKAIDFCLPVALIFLGVAMLWRAMRGQRK